MALRLYYTPGSPFARIVRVLLRELEIACEEVAIGSFPPPPSYFAVNPMGQVPALVASDGVRFPTRIIIDYLLSCGRGTSSVIAPSVRRTNTYWEDDQTLATILAMGDSLAAMKYQQWSGLVSGKENLIGFDPADRHAERVAKTLDWLEVRAGPDGFLPGVLSVQDIALGCILLWVDARGGFAWRRRPHLEKIVHRCAERSSFANTEPQPWP